MKKRERVGNSGAETLEMFQKLGYISPDSDRRGIVTYDDVLPFSR